MKRAIVALAVVAWCSPRAALGEEATTRIHLEVTPRTSASVILESHEDGSSLWVARCVAPCDRQLPLGLDYRVGGEGLRPSPILRLAPEEPGSVVLLVHPVSKRVHDAGLVLVAVGVVAFAIGDVMSDVYLGFEAAELADHRAPPRFASDLVAPGIVIASVGAASFLTGGGMYLATRRPTSLTISTRPAPEPRWYDVTQTGPRLPGATTVSLLSGSF